MSEVAVSSCRRPVSRTRFLKPNSQSLIPHQNTARDQLVSEPSRRRQRADGKRSQRILFVYYFHHREKGCWKSRRKKSQELTKSHGRGFSLRNLSRMDKKLRDVGVIQTSTGWGKRGRRSTNHHAVTHKKAPVSQGFLFIDGKGITLSEELQSKSKPENPFGIVRLPESAHNPGRRGSQRKPKSKSFAWFDPKKFRPRDEFYDVGYTKRAKDHYHRIRFWNSCQELRPKSKRKYYRERYSRPRIRATWKDICKNSRERFKHEFRKLAQHVRMRNSMHGHKMVKYFREMGERAFMAWYTELWGGHWMPITGYRNPRNVNAQRECKWFLRLYLWTFRREDTGMHVYA